MSKSSTNPDSIPLDATDIAASELSNESELRRKPVDTSHGLAKSRNDHPSNRRFLPNACQGADAKHGANANRCDRFRTCCANDPNRCGDRCASVELHRADVRCGCDVGLRADLFRGLRWCRAVDGNQGDPDASVPADADSSESDGPDEDPVPVAAMGVVAAVVVVADAAQGAADEADAVPGQVEASVPVADEDPDAEPVAATVVVEDADAVLGAVVAAMDAAAALAEVAVPAAATAVAVVVVLDPDEADAVDAGLVPVEAVATDLAAAAVEVAVAVADAALAVDEVVAEVEATDLAAVEALVAEPVEAAATDEVPVSADEADAVPVEVVAEAKVAAPVADVDQDAKAVAKVVADEVPVLVPDEMAVAKVVADAAPDVAPDEKVAATAVAAVVVDAVLASASDEAGIHRLLRHHPANPDADPRRRHREAVVRQIVRTRHSEVPCSPPCSKPLRSRAMLSSSVSLFPRTDFVDVTSAHQWRSDTSFRKTRSHKLEEAKTGPTEFGVELTLAPSQKKKELLRAPSRSTKFFGTKTSQLVSWFFSFRSVDFFRLLNFSVFVNFRFLSDFRVSFAVRAFHFFLVLLSCRHCASDRVLRSVSCRLCFVFSVCCVSERTNHHNCCESHQHFFHLWILS